MSTQVEQVAPPKALRAPTRLRRGRTWILITGDLLALATAYTLSYGVASQLGTLPPVSAPTSFLVTLAATAPIVSLQGRYGKPRRGEMADGPLVEMVWAFSLPGQWTAINPGSADCDWSTGELTLPCNVLGLPYNEVMVTYTAGLANIGDDVKSACAQIVRNAQATPALNASRTRIDTMQMQYFSSSLLDETVRAWLRPYVANRLG